MQRISTLVNFLFLVFCVFTPSLLKAQCEVVISSVPDTLVCGDYIQLSVFGEGQGQQVFVEQFDNGNPSGWAFTQQATFTNPCSPNGVNGTPHIWMGDQSAVPRSLETVGYDLTPATAGVTICFDLLFAEQGGSSPCEGPDEPDEGVALQYSTDGGNTWTDIHYYDPNGGNDPDLVNWNNWCFTVPQAAITTNTSFRWFQDNDSGAEYDHWGIDNVNIYYNDPTYNITWQHDNYSYGAGNSGGPNPTPIHPSSTTTYYVEMTNGSFTCSDSVTVVVANPVLEINAGNDTTICRNDCAQLNATAKVVHRPAGLRTYSNFQPESISSVFGSESSVNVNVQTLNMTNVLPNSIAQVCIDKISFFGFQVTPPGVQSAADLDIYLQCPDGTRILLIPAGATQGQNITYQLVPPIPPFFPGVTFNGSDSVTFLNTCFVPGGPPISTGSGTRHSSSYAPDENFNNLTGCSANGVWSIVVGSGAGLFSGGEGTLTGWSITFDDIELSYDADFSWTPTSTLNNPNSLSPIACPQNSQEYILTASDTAGCVTLSDTVFVQVDTVCCNLEFTANVQQPSCGNSDGSITLSIAQGSGSYDVLWSNNQTGLTASNLSAGVYSATIEDLGQSNCIKDTTFTLSNPGAPVIVADTGIAETCLGDADGIAGIIVVGGLPPYTFLWNNNATDSVIFNLSPGNYDVTVSDNNGCQAVTSINVPAGPNCCNISLALASVDPDCGQNNGSISTNVLNGTGNYSYTWNPSGTGSSLTGIGAGTYQLTVEDLGRPNCFTDTVLTLIGTPILGATVDTSICANDPITINGTVYNTAGSYTDTLLSSSGCDSVITLNVSTIQAIGSPPNQNFFNTGNNGSGGTLPGGTNDLNWQVAINSINGTYNPAVVMNGIPTNYYNSPFPDAEWISHSATGGHTVRTSYFYRIDFELPCMDSCGRSFSDQDAFCLALDFFSDNSVFEIYINGTPQSSQIAGIPVATPYTHQGFSQSGMLSVVLCDEWGPGTNTLILEVLSDPGYAGFLAQTSVNTPPFISNYDTIPITVYAPDTITIDGVDIYEPGLYAFELTNAFGCDSNIVLNVDVIPLSFTDVFDTICSSDQFVFGNNVITQAGEYTDTLLGSVGQDSIVTLYLQVNEVTLNLSSVEISCFDANDGSITAVATSDNPPLQYNWSNSSTDTFINNLSSGTYILVVSDQSNCSATDTVELTNPEELALDLGPDVILCFGESETIDAGQYTTYLWSTGDSSSNIVVTTSGTFEVTVTNVDGCEATDEIVVSIGDSLLVDAGADTSIVEFNEAQLRGLINGGTSPSGQYFWSPDYLLSCDDCLDPIVGPNETQEFVLSYTEGNCTVYDTVLVEVLEGEYYLYMPTAFSPNGDGINDLYAPIYAGVDRWVFEIYNRWGEMIYQSRDIDDEWDGTFKGDEVKPGVYVFRIYAEFVNLQTVTRKGSITIVR